MTNNNEDITYTFIFQIVGNAHMVWFSEISAFFVEGCPSTINFTPMSFCYSVKHGETYKIWPLLPPPYLFQRTSDDILAWPVSGKQYRHEMAIKKGSMMKRRKCLGLNLKKFMVAVIFPCKTKPRLDGRVSQCSPVCWHYCSADDSFLILPYYFCCCTVSTRAFLQNHTLQCSAVPLNWFGTWLLW